MKQITEPVLRSLCSCTSRPGDLPFPAHTGRRSSTMKHRTQGKGFYRKRQSNLHIRP